MSDDKELIKRENAFGDHSDPQKMQCNYKESQWLL